MPRRFAPRNDRGRYALASADTLPPSACHCEERGNRPATWQSVLFAVARNEKQHFGQIRRPLRIRLKCYFLPAFSAGRGLPRRFAPRNDRGRYALASAGAWQVPAHLTRQTFLHPLTRLCLLHVIANQCAHWCGNPRPCREPWQPNTTLGKSAALSRIRLRHCPLPCPTAGVTDCRVASLLAMTCKNLLRVRTARRHYRANLHPPAHSPGSPPCPRTHLPAFRCHCGDVSQTQRQRFFAGIFPFAPSPWEKTKNSAPRGIPGA